MLLQENEHHYVPYLVFDARRVLASVLTISQEIHASAYSIPSVALELGVPVEYLRDDSGEMVGSCTRDERGLVIALNEDVEDTLDHMAALCHELGHAVAEEIAALCTGDLKRQKERDAWLRGIYIAISRQLAEGIDAGDLTVTQVAARCCVPVPIIKIRMALAVALGEIDGDIKEAYDEVTAQLLMLQEWFKNGRRNGFRERVEA